MKKIIVIFVLVIILIIGCSKAAPTDTLYRGHTSNRGLFSAAELSFDDAVIVHDRVRTEESIDTEAANLSNSERKLVKRAFINIRVENLEAAEVSVSELLRRYGAYSATTEADDNFRSYSVRVPSHYYDVFLTEMDGIGRLIRRSESTEDVTLRYYDLEGRLEMKRELLKTFQAYLTRARNIEEILSVEARIAELQNDIDSTGVQLRHLANRVDYATIELTLLGPVTAKAKSMTFGERIKQLFGSFGKFLSTVTIIFIGIIIFGIPLLLMITFLFWILFGKIGLIRRLWVLVIRRK